MVRLFTVEAVSRPVQWKGYGILRPYLSLRVENRPSVLGIFIYVPWGGVGWDGVTTFTFLRTPMMLRHGTFTCTCAQLRTYVMLR